MLPLVALLAFLPAPTSKVMFLGSPAACPAWQGDLPEKGTHTFMVTDGKRTSINVPGVVQPSAKGETLVVIYYHPENVTCPSIVLEK